METSRLEQDRVKYDDIISLSLGCRTSVKAAGELRHWLGRTATPFDGDDQMLLKLGEIPAQHAVADMVDRLFIVLTTQSLQIAQFLRSLCRN